MRRAREEGEGHFLCNKRLMTKESHSLSLRVRSYLWDIHYLKTS